MISSSFSHGVLPLLRSLRIAKNGGGRGVYAKGRGEGPEGTLLIYDH